MFIQMLEQMNQAETDLHKKADAVLNSEADINERQYMNAAIDVVFKTLRGQLSSLEKEVAGIPRMAGWHEDFELEARKHAARFGPTNEELAS